MNNKFWKDWKIVGKVSEGGIGSVYKVVNDDGAVCALKYVGISNTKEAVNLLIKKGTIKNYQEFNDYYMTVVNCMNNEIEIMKRLNGNPYIVNYYDSLHENRKDGTGTDFYIRMEYVTDIKEHFSSNAIDVNDVVKLGIDICSALESCNSLNVVHADIKPSNIFIGSDNKYKLGDFGGVSKLESNNFGKFGTFNYASPETYKKEALTNSTDLYSLGLVMYKLLDGELPFVRDGLSETAAFNARMSGKKIPIIRDLNENLMEILWKACAFDTKDRYSNATQMKEDLKKIESLNVKKKIVNFSSGSLEETVGIYELEELGRTTFQQNNADKIKNIFNYRKTVKSILLTGILIILAGFLITGYSFTKKCDAGYINKDGTCVRGYYYCDTGYVLNMNNKCQKTIESVDAKATYTCKSGYTLAGEKCINNDVKDPEFVYNCADGFTLNGTKCEKVESADAVVTYTCPSGYVSAGDKCITVTNITADSKYVCPDSSYTLNGTKCYKTEKVTEKASIQYSCDNNVTPNGNLCEYTVAPSGIGWYKTCSKGTYNYSDGLCHYTVSANYGYYCASGTSDGNGNCYSYTTVSKDATIEYTCPSGYVLAGDRCATTTGVNATVKYNCADSMVLSGKKCYATISTDAVGLYACPEGYVASGVKCYRDDIHDAIKKYRCSKVYTLNGDKCEKYETVSAKEYYYDDNSKKMNE